MSVTACVYDGMCVCVSESTALTIGWVGEGVIDDGVQCAGPPGGGHSREARHQAGEDEELLLGTAVPQGLQPQQEQTDPLTADLHTKGTPSPHNVCVTWN